MLKNKIKSLLRLKGLKDGDYSEKLGIHRLSLSRKFRLNVFSLNDICDLGELTNTKLSLVDRQTNVIIMTIDKEDLEVEEKDHSADCAE